MCSELNFFMDDVDQLPNFIDFDRVSNINLPSSDSQMKHNDLSKVKLPLNLLEKNPVSLIYELHPLVKWEIIEKSIYKNVIPFFRIKLILDNFSSIGCGRSIKLAKKDAAKIALLNLHNITLLNEKAFHFHSQAGLYLDQDIADRIGESVVNKSELVFKSLNATSWSVLAAMVLTRTDDHNYIDIICLTTGTKCIKGDALSMQGYSINDSHAEVLARRCFIFYLYQQLLALVKCNYKDRADFIIEQRPDGTGFRLKECIRVHLFISTAPCGDARVFGPKEEEEIDPHPNVMSQGLLRAKVESGAGTIPVKKDTSLLTWDGVLHGDQRIQFMSCSDKIALWNVVGIQGSLLSHFIEPIYLESLILASLFSPDHLTRAIFGRFNLKSSSIALEDLPYTFKLNRCLIAKCSVKEAFTCREVSRTPPYAINWIRNNDTEIIKCETGKLCNDKGPSRLCKRSFFLNFCSLLYQSIPILSSSPLRNEIPAIYEYAKASAQPFQKAKLRTIQAFVEQDLGNWIHVPSEVDLFGA